MVLANFLCVVLGGFIDLGLFFEMGIVSQTFHFWPIPGTSVKKSGEHNQSEVKKSGENQLKKVGNAKQYFLGLVGFGYGFGIWVFGFWGKTSGSNKKWNYLSNANV